MTVPEDHPRHASLTLRERLTGALHEGILAPQGLIAHGRGEALDYLLREASHDFAQSATRHAAGLLASARWPVLSVNGNAAALCPKGFAELSAALSCPLEVNLFHYTPERANAIKAHLERHGAQNVLTQQAGSFLLNLSSDRRLVHPEGILKADVVLVPLEDGDRCEALKANGKRVIAIDLNPLSRTAQMADVSIIDNLVRAIPALTAGVQNGAKPLDEYDNPATLKAAEKALRTGNFT